MGLIPLLSVLSSTGVNLLKEHPPAPTVTLDLLEEIYPKQDFKFILTAIKSC